MATQALPLGYSGDVQADGKDRDPRFYPRAQGSWGQFGAAVVPRRVRPEFSIGRRSDQNLPVEVMIQPEITVVALLIRNSSAVLAEIDALIAGGDDEVKPTEYAYRKARSFVESAYGQVKLRESVPEIVPEALVTTDDVGGIRLAWRVGPKQVRANVGADASLQSYIYFESGTQHAVEQLDVPHLAGRLAWLTER